MKIYEFALPAILASHLKAGGHTLSEKEMRHLQALLVHVKNPRPKLWGYAQIVSQHRLWSTDAAGWYLGTESADYFPGRIDPARTLIVGEADQDDSPIALDYRAAEPRVVYLGDVGPKGVWVELAPSYEALFEKLADAASDIVPSSMPPKMYPNKEGHRSMATPRSPRITDIVWGRMEVEGLGSGKDFKLYPGGGRGWDWAETGTHHVPGIQPADVQELLQRGSEVVVLSRGMQLALLVCRETLEMLAGRNIPVFVEETNAAVSIYNELVARQQLVGGLFHSTC